MSADPARDALLPAVEALGPLTGSHVLVVRGTEFPEDAVDQLLAHLMAAAVDNGTTAPLVVFLSEPESSLAALDEEQMREHGWIRAERMGIAP